MSVMDDLLAKVKSQQGDIGEPLDITSFIEQRPSYDSGVDRENYQKYIAGFGKPQLYEGGGTKLTDAEQAQLLKQLDAVGGSQPLTDLEKLQLLSLPREDWTDPQMSGFLNNIILGIQGVAPYDPAGGGADALNPRDGISNLLQQAVRGTVGYGGRPPSDLFQPVQNIGGANAGMAALGGAGFALGEAGIGAGLGLGDVATVPAGTIGGGGASGVGFGTTIGGDAIPAAGYYSGADAAAIGQGINPETGLPMDLGQEEIGLPGTDISSTGGGTGIDPLGPAAGVGGVGAAAGSGGSSVFGLPGKIPGLPGVSIPGVGGVASGAANNPILAALAIAGLLEGPNNPLTQPTVDAVKAAMDSGRRIQAMTPPGITPSFQRAIDTANSNVGAWKPYIDKASAFDTAGGSPITGDDISRYMSPYIEQALNPAARKINEAAAATRIGDAAKAGARGAFGTSRNDQLMKLTDRNEQMALGDLYGTGFQNAFNTALTTAGADKSRALSAGGAFDTLGKTTSSLGASDVTGLTGAGGIETLPYTEAINQEKTAGDVLTGAAAAGAKALPSTGTPSLLSNIAGVAGLLNNVGGTPSGSSSGGFEFPNIPNFNSGSSAFPTEAPI